MKNDTLGAFNKEGDSLEAGGATAYAKNDFFRMRNVELKKKLYFFMSAKQINSVY